MSYDSRPATLEHIGQVQKFLALIVVNLTSRARLHDQSKLQEPEKSVFDTYTPLLKSTEYGSEEYRRFLDGMGEGLRHHYAVNDHHPEHFENGIADMNLLQLLEMLADWKAATLRMPNGDLGASITINRERFGYGDRTEHLLRSTAEALGWL